MTLPEDNNNLINPNNNNRDNNNGSQLNVETNDIIDHNIYDVHHQKLKSLRRHREELLMMNCFTFTILLSIAFITAFCILYWQWVMLSVTCEITNVSVSSHGISVTSVVKVDSYIPLVVGVGSARLLVSWNDQRVANVFIPNTQLKLGYGEPNSVEVQTMIEPEGWMGTIMIIKSYLMEHEDYVNIVGVVPVKFGWFEHLIRVNVTKKVRLSDMM